MKNDLSNKIEKIRSKYLKLFKVKPILIESPGRVNLIGEHTDYNDGYVLPAAIDKKIILAIEKSDDDICTFYSFDLAEKISFKISEIEKRSKEWANYLLGVIDQLKKRNKRISAFNCVFGGNIPIGSGLSSSAAIEGGLIFALNYLFKLKLKPIEMVKIAQAAENEFVGVRCGIMDQYVNIFGLKKKVMQIDCRDLSYNYLPFEDDALRFVLCNSMVKHSLASSEYNIRRIQCEEGINIISRKFKKVESLRDVNMKMLESCAESMNPIIFKRCKYVIEENRRVKFACDALKKNDFRFLGKLMSESHQGLNELYEVSCNELNYLVAVAEKFEGVFGSRMMGGGFGGCTINLVEADYVSEFSEKIVSEFFGKFDVKPEIYVCGIERGTNIINL